MKYLIGFITMLFCSLNLLADGTPLTDKDKSQIDEVINHCESRYQGAKTARSALVQHISQLSEPKKPSFFSSGKLKKQYKEALKKYTEENYDKTLKLKAFDANMAQFDEFMTEQNALQNARTVEKLQDIIDPFSSNCVRFADGLIKFVKWSLGQKIEKGYDRIFIDWVKKVQ